MFWFLFFGSTVMTAWGANEFIPLQVKGEFLRKEKLLCLSIKFNLVYRRHLPEFDDPFFNESPEIPLLLSQKGISSNLQCLSSHVQSDYRGYTSVQCYNVISDKASDELENHYGNHPVVTFQNPKDIKLI